MAGNFHSVCELEDQRVMKVNHIRLVTRTQIKRVGNNNGKPN